MRDLNYQLKQLCRRNRDGSFATQADWERMLSLLANQPREMGAYRAPSGRPEAGRKVPLRGPLERNASNWLDPGQTRMPSRPSRCGAGSPSLNGDRVMQRREIRAAHARMFLRPALQGEHDLDSVDAGSGLRRIGQHTAAGRRARGPCGGLNYARHSELAGATAAVEDQIGRVELSEITLQGRGQGVSPAFRRASAA